MTKTKKWLTKCKNGHQFYQMVAIFICFLKIGYQIKTKKGTGETSMECQIVLTCNDLEKQRHKRCTNCCFCYVFACFSVLVSQTGVLLSMDC